MKTLLASIIIGLLSLSPAFAQNTMDTKQKETDQKRTEQTGEQKQVSPKSDQDQLKKTAQDRQGTTGTDSQGVTGQDRQGMTGQDRQSATDPARANRASEMKLQEGYQRVSSDLITADDLQGANVYGANNESVADVNEVLMTPAGKVEKIVVNVGGFLGMGARSIALDVNDVDIQKDAKDDVRVYIPMTEEELRKMPEYKK